MEQTGVRTAGEVWEVKEAQEAKEAKGTSRVDIEMCREICLMLCCAVLCVTRVGLGCDITLLISFNNGRVIVGKLDGCGLYFNLRRNG